MTTSHTSHPTKAQLGAEIKALVDQYRGRDLPYWSRDPRSYSTGYLLKMRDNLRQAVELKAKGETYKALLYFCGDTILLEKLDRETKGQNHA